MQIAMPIFARIQPEESGAGSVALPKLSALGDGTGSFLSTMVLLGEPQVSADPAMLLSAEGEVIPGAETLFAAASTPTFSMTEMVEPPVADPAVEMLPFEADEQQVPDLKVSVATDAHVSQPAPEEIPVQIVGREEGTRSAGYQEEGHWTHQTPVETGAMAHEMAHDLASKAPPAQDGAAETTGRTPQPEPGAQTAQDTAQPKVGSGTDAPRNVTMPEVPLAPGGAAVTWAGGEAPSNTSPRLDPLAPAATRLPEGPELSRFAAMIANTQVATDSTLRDAVTPDVVAEAPPSAEASAKVPAQDVIARPLAPLISGMNLADGPASAAVPRPGVADAFADPAHPIRSWPAETPVPALETQAPGVLRTAPAVVQGPTGLMPPSALPIGDVEGLVQPSEPVVRDVRGAEAVAQATPAQKVHSAPRGEPAMSIPPQALPGGATVASDKRAVQAEDSLPAPPPPPPTPRGSDSLLSSPPQTQAPALATMIPAAMGFANPALPPRFNTDPNGIEGGEGDLAAIEVKGVELPAARLDPVPSRAELPRHLAQQVADVARMMPDRPVELTLSPEELGRLRLTFNVDGGAMAVAVTAERPETMDLLRRHIDMLAQELRDIGYDDVSFDFGQRDGSQAQGEGAETGVTGHEPPSPALESSTEAAPTAVRLDLTATSGMDIRL